MLSPPAGPGSLPPLRARIIDWTRAVAVAGSGNLLAQGLALVTGFLIVRALSTEQYAAYTITAATLAALTALGDSGVAITVSGEGGKVWQDRDALGAVINSGFQWRRRLCAWVVPFGSLWLVVLLRHHGTSWPEVLLLVGCLVAQVTTALGASLFAVPLSLHQKNWETQRVLTAQNAARLVTTGCALTFLPFAWAAAALTGVAQLAASRFLKAKSLAVADLERSPSSETTRRIGDKIRHLMPTAAYHVFSSQLTTWIITLWGTTGAVADVGALSRIGQLSVVASSTVAAVVLPRYARLPNHGKALRRFFLLCVGALSALGGVAVLVTASFPDLFLAVLGPRYADLRFELVLVALGAAAWLVASSAAGMATVRGWVIPPFIYIGALVATQLVAVLILDLRSVRGVLLIGLVNVLPALALHTANMFRHTSRTQQYA